MVHEKSTSSALCEKLLRGAAQSLPEGGLLEKIKSGKKLVIKFGADPTAPDLHLGHAVVLSKLREFQDLGHDVIFLIGDFTAAIGDPTGKSKTRIPLTQEEIRRNTVTYCEQVSRVLDPQKTIIRYNSEWLGALTPIDIVKLCAKTTLARLTEREDFTQRIENNQPISFHELLYPLFQGYDSVALNADVELGGTDQTFNLLFGRFLQEHYGKEPQVILTVPLLEGLDGVQKMSKSLGNAIGLTEPADQAYGKLMSISDTLMWRYFKLLLGTTDHEISVLQERIAGGTLHPMALKKQMAHDIVEKFWSKSDADAAQEKFEAVFQNHDLSQGTEVALEQDTPKNLWIVDFLKQLGAVKNSSEAKRLIEDGAVKIDNEPVTDFKAEITWKSGMLVKVGKHRVYKIK
ncbi:MAG: tyrosine--tRNA ligase [Candidatus Babeliales bacterium]